MTSKLQSIETKIILVLLAVFISLIAITTIVSTYNERNIVMDLAIENTTQIARNYFDNVNTMMLSGTMTTRAVLRQKLLETEGIDNVKIIRAEALTEQFPSVNPEQVIEDDLDRRGINSIDPNPIVVTGDNRYGRTVSVVLPMLAISNYKGTNCLGCHVASEGSLLGTVRVDYSLEHLDSKITSNLWRLSAVNISVMIIGLIVIAWYTQKRLLNPLLKIRGVMAANAQNKDLTQHAIVTHSDEIGQLGTAFNNLQSQFSHSLSSVSHAVNLLKSCSGEISDSSEQTLKAATDQRRESEKATSGINLLDEAAELAAKNALHVADASIEANKEVNNGTATTSRAISGILELVSRIDDASVVIQSLNTQTRGVSSVLDVIKNIAEQTNLLALNAAIEAARAGEQGRGFAVVADEVRTLATRSHESTQEIEKIIEQLQAGAQQAVDAMEQAKVGAEQRRQEVEEADNKLKLIAHKVAVINSGNTSMNQSITEQREITLQVRNNIESIDTLSESTTRDAELTSQLSNKLERISDDLDTLIKQFKFDETKPDQ